MATPVIASAPGKVILFGEHAVVHGKSALAASLSNLRTFAHLAVSETGEVALELPDLPSSPAISFTVSELAPLRSYFHGSALTDAEEQASSGAVDDEKALAALKALCAQKGADEGSHHFSALVVFLYLYLSLSTISNVIGGTSRGEGVRVRIRSTVPVGAGLGSSAAFSVSCAAVLLQHFHGQSATEGSPEATNKANINRWALKAEKIIHGTPSGIDNSIATFGGALTFHRKQVEDRVQGVIEHLNSFPSLKFIITNTSVPRKTSVLVAGVRSLKEQYPEVTNPILDSIHSITTKATHYLTTEGDASQLHLHLASLININHHLLNAVGVGHPQLDKIRLISSRYKLHSKLTGAGGGGCAFTLLTNDVDHDEVLRLITELDQEFGPNSSLITGIGGAGVTFHPSPDDLPPQFFA